MRILIVEDDVSSQKLLQTMLSPYGDCDIAVNGKEAVDAFRLAGEEGKPYDLICLDIMMPEMDGQEALKKIREMEKEKGIQEWCGVKVIMTTALEDGGNIFGAFETGCESYLVKPISKQKLIREMKKLRLINAD